MSEAAPPTESILLSDLITVRHPGVRHPVQGRAPHQQLSGLTIETARTGTGPEDHLEPEDGHLRQRAPMVFIVTFPLSAPVSAKVAQVLITVVSVTFSVPMTPDTRSLLRRNDSPRLALFDGLVTLPVVVAAVARHLLQLIINLLKQVSE